MTGRRIVSVPDDGSWDGVHPDLVGLTGDDVAQLGELVTAELAEIATRDAVTPGRSPRTAAWALGATPPALADLVALDPGSSYSAMVALADGLPIEHARLPNESLLYQLRAGWLDAGERGFFLPRPGPVVCEWMSPRGMPTSAQELETCWWAGRFTEALTANGYRLERITRERVKRHLIGSNRPKGGPSADARIRAALVDHFGGTGGKAAAIGLKASPGPLYGIAADEWAALAVAVAWLDGAR